MTQPPFEKPMPPSRAEVAGLAAIGRNLEEQRAALVTTQGRNEPLPRFVELADKMFDAAIEAAKQQVTRAQNLLKQVEQEAAETRQRARERWDDIQQLERDLEDMSSDMLQTFHRHNGVKK